MKKITLILAAAFMLACSDDDSGSTGTPDSFSAHMKTECPSDSETPIFDVCVSESQYDYLAELRASTEIPNSCLWVEFEGLDGELHEGWLISVEKNQVDCN